MSNPATLLREARNAAGLTQAELAARLGTTQSAVARLESDGANPRIETLARAVRACGRELSLRAGIETPSIDETLVAQHLRMPPDVRLKSFERSYANVRAFAMAAAKSRGELA